MDRQYDRQYLQDEGKLDAVITILKTIKNIDMHYKQSTKIEEIKRLLDKDISENTSENTFKNIFSITTRMLFDSWKLGDLRKGFHDNVNHFNGWIFVLNRFRTGISSEDYHNKDGRISMMIYISKRILENKYPNMIMIEIADKSRAFDRLFSLGSKFWIYSKLKFIDFDDCCISELKPFLEWCDLHNAEEILDLE